MPVSLDSRSTAISPHPGTSTRSERGQDTRDAKGGTFPLGPAQALHHLGVTWAASDHAVWASLQVRVRRARMPDVNFQALLWGLVWASPPLSILATPAGTSTLPKPLTPGAFQPGLWEELTALLVSEDPGRVTTFTRVHACAHTHTRKCAHSQRQQTVEVGVTKVPGGL